MQLNDIFYENEYKTAYKIASANGYTIKEIERDEKGRRFQIIEPPKPTQKELDEYEISGLKDQLNKTDYVANKLAEAMAKYFTNGDKTELEQLITNYSEIIKQRESWRARIRELE